VVPAVVRERVQFALSSPWYGQGEWIKTMRILIQQKDTGSYFKDVGAWTRNVGEAMDFLSSTTAIDFCLLNKISGVQLVLKFEEQQYDIVLPVMNPKPRRTNEPHPPV
jgi:hypothetical protein